MDQLEELVRLQAVLIRLLLPTQQRAIVELGRAGFGPARIAQLLGTTASTASVTLQRDRKAGRKSGGSEPVKLAPAKPEPSDE
ncbi:hypothetical protein ACQHIV_13060 [Kribbella sp. GL6]|uniref:hypothetical protein n=1 Tax=Kribbella sp. GL6 TaxID=3419765 RepID=UPI003D051850